MEGVLEFIFARGEYVALLIVTVALVALVGRTAMLLRLNGERVGDLWWSGGLAFVLSGRIAFLLLESPRTLLDPLVAIRLQGGFVPLAGIAGGVAAWAWFARREAPSARIALLAAAAAGLVIAAISYDLACFARDACAGRAASAPLGVALPGLTQARIPAPLIEAALMLLASGVLLLRLPPAVALIAAGGVAALLRAALAPLSIRGMAALDAEAAGFALLGVALLAVAAWVARGRAGEPSTPAEAQALSKD